METASERNQRRWADALPMAAIAQPGGTFDWLADEPGLYTDADLVKLRAG